MKLTGLCESFIADIANVSFVSVVTLNVTDEIRSCREDLHAFRANVLIVLDGFGVLVDDFFRHSLDVLLSCWTPLSRSFRCLLLLVF